MSSPTFSVCRTQSERWRVPCAATNELPISHSTGLRRGNHCLDLRATRSMRRRCGGAGPIGCHHQRSHCSHSHARRSGPPSPMQSCPRAPARRRPSANALGRRRLRPSGPGQQRLRDNHSGIQAAPPTTASHISARWERDYRYMLAMRVSHFARGRIPASHRDPK